MVKIISLSAETAKPYFDQMVDIYQSAFTVPPYSDDLGDVLTFSGRLPYHARWKGFRCVAAFDQAVEPFPLVGFAYGFTSQPDHWWRELVSGKMSQAMVQDWLEDCFEFVELAVTPAYQRRQIGGGLHDALLAGLNYRTAVLSTLQEETNALHLYRKRGWINLLENFKFPGIERTYLIMGLRLIQNLDW